MLRTLVLTMAAAMTMGAASADKVVVSLALVTADGVGAPVGVISLTDTPDGAMLMANLKGLPPGPHGLHVHANGSCAPGPGKDGAIMAAGAAGGHYDPNTAGKHMGPMGDGHLGDLPLITVGADGTFKGMLMAPHIHSVGALKGHAVMIHAGGDTYSDTPAPLGGGGARIACGVAN